MLINSEKQLLNFVKYSPIVIIVIIGFIVNTLIYYQNEVNYKKDLILYEKNFIETNKTLVKIHVEKVYNQIKEEQKTLKKELKEELKKRVNEAYSIIDSIYKKYSYKNKEEILSLIKTSLRNIRFNDNRGYFYIYQMDGINVLHPIRPKLEGKSLENIKDKKNQLLLKETIESLKKQKYIYKEITWVKPNDLKKEYKKITFNKHYKNLDIMVGTGEYIDEFEKKIKKHLLHNIQNILYGKNGYVFVFDYNGLQLAHLKKSYVGKNRLDVTDANGKKIVQTIINKAKQGSGFVSYIGTIMPQTGKPAEKITYVKGLDEWKWAIGSGFYNKEMLELLEIKAKELKKINKEATKKTFIISLIITIFLIFIASYISNILNKFFNDYNKRIQGQVLENRKKDVILHQQSKMASMGEMIGNIAHQWRQPLNLISTATSRIKLEDELGLLTKESHYESLDAIKKSTEYLSKTIDDFREFFKPNKVLNEVSTEDLYKKVVQLLSARFKNKDIFIKADVKNIDIVIYENEFIQALINILNNAIDAFEEKQIEEKVILFKIDYDKKNKNYIQITITDNAGGIKEENINKVFDAYFTTKHQSQGTGIGLYMTYQIILNKLFGKINVTNHIFEYKSKIYTGAKFSIILPVK